MINRRQLSSALLASLAGLPSLAGAQPTNSLGRAFADIEQMSGGRLGICVLDTGSGLRAGHRQDERFPLCSTFKLLAAAAVLARVDKGQLRLDQRIVYGAGDLVAGSPETKLHVGEGMPLAAVCKAAITLSDNTGGNLMLAQIGGPAGLTRFARTLGDGLTRLDRTETTLNEARPGDPRDTTTPQAMLGDMHRLLLGSALSVGSRQQLLEWLEANKTGDKRLRAGLPADWRVGDKTGSGENGTANVIAIVRPPQRAPILVTAYLTATTASTDLQNASLAAVGAAIAGSA